MILQNCDYLCRSMKKLVLTISFLCYLTVTCGVVVNLHYCMDRLASIHFFGEESDQCGQCGMMLHASNPCCHDEVKVFKLEQDQVKLADTDYSIPAIAETVTLPSEFINAPFETELYHVISMAHPPPLLSEQDTYLQINVFRI